MGYRVGLDIGGTLADRVVTADTSRISKFKPGSTPFSPIAGLLNMLQKAADYFSQPLETFLSQVDTLTPGIAVATDDTRPCHVSDGRTDSLQVHMLETKFALKSDRHIIDFMELPVN